MITMVVECSIIAYATTAEGEHFSMGTVCNMFFYMVVFFTAPPLAIYFFARMKLLDGTT